MITKAPFGALSDGTKIDRYRLENSCGTSVDIMTLGGAILEFRCRDCAGNFDNIILRHPTAEDYAQGTCFLGALIGRFANRIKNSRFIIGGKSYQLTPNEGENHLHGGPSGFHKKVWQAKAEDHHLLLTLHSADGENGYPGNLDVAVTYELTEQNELVIQYRAISDQDTYLNLTNHAYFNLSGGTQDILGHELYLNAHSYVPIDAHSIPYARIDAVSGTPFDFQTPHSIGSRIDQPHEQLQHGSGYDHNFCLSTDGQFSQMAAQCYEPTSGRVLNVYTTMPGIQFYSGNFLDSTAHPRRSGFCLETQYFPDGPNVPLFNCPILKQGVLYQHKTVYQVSVKE